MSSEHECEIKQAFEAIKCQKMKAARVKCDEVCGGGEGGNYLKSACETGSAAGASTIAIFPAGYGFVVLTAIGSIMMVAWKSMKVGMARDEFKIPYPQIYSSDNVAFNCVMRAHQNTMETYPQFLLMLMIGGLEMPYFCTLGGCIWISGRIMYAKGYYTGDPMKRSKGTVSIIGMAMLFAATVKFAWKHMGG